MSTYAIKNMYPSRVSTTSEKTIQLKKSKNISGHVTKLNPYFVRGPVNLAMLLLIYALLLSSSFKSSCFFLFIFLSYPQNVSSESESDDSIFSMKTLECMKILNFLLFIIICYLSTKY